MGLNGEGTPSNAEQGEQLVLVTSHVFLWDCKKGSLESQEKE